MKDQLQFDLYTGRGLPLSKRNPAVELPLFRKVDEFDHPAGYVAEDGLRDAVNVALSLGQPLLVTGEPGTGKTQLAATIAYELELPPPLVFNTTTNSVARDLFYQYDSLRHGAWRVPHASFADRSHGGLPPRESIEIRAIAYFA